MARPQRRAYFAIALRLGMTVRQLLAAADSAELSEWIAFFELERDGDKPKPTPKDEIEAWKMAFGITE